MIESLADILKQVRAGDIDASAAEQLIRGQLAQPLGFATVDHDRMRRCGSSEVIYAAGKTAEQIVAIAQAIRRRHQVALITRATPAHVEAVRREFDHDRIEIASRAGTILIGQPPPPPEGALRPVPIVTAGTSDEPVAEEAELTCKALGQVPLRVNDIGVAGLHRLGSRLDDLRRAAVVVCIAGMEGALPSVVGGLVEAPVIAVPTSVGYGAAFGGIAALLGMLTSCASGVVVVNIDNGFGAAFTACMINKRAAVAAKE